RRRDRVPGHRRVRDENCALFVLHQVNARAAPPEREEEEPARLLEARGQTDCEGPRVRERERVDRIDGRRLRLPAGDADLRIEAAIAGDRPEVAPDETDLPIALTANRTETVRDEELANLGVARILDRAIVRAEKVVDAAEPVSIVRLSGAVVIADRFGRLDRLPVLIDVMRQEVQVRPMKSLVPDVLADRGIEQAIP